MNYWYTQQTGQIQNSLYWIKEARPKHVYNVQFHLHKTIENKQCVILTHKISSCSGQGMDRGSTNCKGHRKHLRLIKNILYFACGDGFTDIYIHLSDLYMWNEHNVLSIIHSSIHLNKNRNTIWYYFFNLSHRFW